VKNTVAVIGKEASSSDEEEPPGCSSLINVEEDKPPSTKAKENRARFFGDIPDRNWNDWKWQFRNRILIIEQLSKYIPLSQKEKEQLDLVTTKFPISITPYYLCLIDTDNPDDPIMKQAVPSFKELAFAGMGFEDPLEERKDSVVLGLVQRYPDRVLMVLTNLCPMLCRHCTRKREWRNGNWVRTQDEIRAMLDYIRNNRNVRDVIISGGDPLTLSTTRLEEVLSGLRRIDHVEIIRLGTRFPVVLPQRIDDELCSMLSRYGPIWVNTHFNSPREITEEAARACDSLLRSGIPVNNQSVLLKGVNDTIETHTKLCHELLRIKVRPYYLYQCDEVQGTEHLRTPVETGIKIIEGMRGHTSGLAVPTFVIDLPDGGGKVPLQPTYVLSQKKHQLILRNYEYKLFRYRNPNGAGQRKNGRGNGKGVEAPGAQPHIQLTA
jgi:lysine 2,3-aminomutase